MGNITCIIISGYKIVQALPAQFSYSIPCQGPGSTGIRAMKHQPRAPAQAHHALAQARARARPTGPANPDPPRGGLPLRLTYPQTHTKN